MSLKKLISKLIQKPSKDIFVQMFRYLISGGTALLLDMGVMILLKEYFGISATNAAVIGFIIGLIYTYILSIKWIFNERKMKNALSELAIFACIGLVGIGITWMLMTFFTKKPEIHYILAKLITTAIVTLWNFIAKKEILFTNKKRC